MFEGIEILASSFKKGFLGLFFFLVSQIMCQNFHKNNTDQCSPLLLRPSLPWPGSPGIPTHTPTHPLARSHI